jgi:hypothetical protein
MEELRAELERLQEAAQGGPCPQCGGLLEPTLCGCSPGRHDESAELRAELEQVRMRLQRAVMDSPFREIQQSGLPALLARLGADLPGTPFGRAAVNCIRSAQSRLDAIAKEARLIPANTRGSKDLRDRLLELAEGREG